MSVLISRKDQALIKQYEKLLVSFRKWKESQQTADADIRQQLQKYSELVQFLQEEKLKYLGVYHNLYQDHIILQAEMEKVKKNIFR